MDPVAFQVGNFAVRWYGILYLLGFLLCGWIGWPEFQRCFRAPFSQFLDLITYMMGGVLIGGRLGYVVLYDSAYYVRHLLDVLKIWQGGMSFHGALLGLFVAIYGYSISYRVPLLGLLDLAVSVGPLSIFLGRIGNFINGELYGRVTTVPWGMMFPDGGPFVRHPSQLYEAVLEGAVLFILMQFLYRKGQLKPGQLTGIFVLCYSVIRFFLEFLREPDVQIGLTMGLSRGQLLSLGLIGMASIWIFVCSRNGQNSGQ